MRDSTKSVVISKTIYDYERFTLHDIKVSYAI